jgi:hypothetical protein
MKIKELRAIAKVMEECGIVFLKTSDIELHRKFHVERVAEVGEKTIATPIPISVAQSSEIKHTEELLTSVMKLSDTELVDKLFPDHTTAQDKID